jgi:hypothetical protein
MLTSRQGTRPTGETWGWLATGRAVAQAQRTVREDPFVLDGLVKARWLKRWTPASE